MKDQYFGDVNDYRKYGLIRLLSGHGQLQTAVCWALTPGDSGSDGSRIAYLGKPREWGKYDTSVFEHLKNEVLMGGRRAVESVQREEVLPNCRFFSEYLGDDRIARKQYFDEFFRYARGAEIVFFDPDNGLWVKSVPCGKRNSSKYIYEDELTTAFGRGHSILIYQHYPRCPRLRFIQATVRRLGNLLGTSNVLTFSTSHAVFLLVSQPHHLEMLRANSAEVPLRWENQFAVVDHAARGPVGEEYRGPIGPKTTPGIRKLKGAVAS